MATHSSIPPHVPMAAQAAVAQRHVKVGDAYDPENQLSARAAENIYSSVAGTCTLNAMGMPDLIQSLREGNPAKDISGHPDTGLVNGIEKIAAICSEYQGLHPEQKSIFSEALRANESRSNKHPTDINELLKLGFLPTDSDMAAFKPTLSNVVAVQHRAEDLRKRWGNEQDPDVKAWLGVRIQEADHVSHAMLSQGELNKQLSSTGVTPDSVTNLLKHGAQPDAISIMEITSKAKHDKAHGDAWQTLLHEMKTDEKYTAVFAEYARQVDEFKKPSEQRKPNQAPSQPQQEHDNLPNGALAAPNGPRAKPNLPHMDLEGHHPVVAVTTAFLEERTPEIKVLTKGIHDKVGDSTLGWQDKVEAIKVRLGQFEQGIHTTDARIEALATPQPQGSAKQNIR